MMYSKKDEILRVAKAASVDVLEETKPLHEVLSICRDISRSLKISKETAWVDLELNGYLVNYQAEDRLWDNLPSYRRTDWKFYDVYGNVISLPPDITTLFGKSVVYHSIQELENSEEVLIDGKFLEKFNEFISHHGTDYASKNVRIHEARIPKEEINRVLDGLKARIHEFLDIVISVLEFD